MGIDDLADRNTRNRSPGERFREEWLDDLPEGQWPSYIDETARLVSGGIAIGETELTTADFSYETGRSYRRGLAASTGITLSETSLPIGQYSATDVGSVGWEFNRLHGEIQSSSTASFENPSRAVEAAVNKAVAEQYERREVAAEQLETIRLPESAGVSTLVSEAFCRPRNEQYLDLLVETVKGARETGQSLLERLDEPRMVTPLWEHQRRALGSWLANDCRGYVDMATATGKTVLGLAAIAHHFGALHPDDRELTVESLVPGRDDATVVVVAHRDLILDQWKREFDTHLNIPEQRSTQSGEHTVRFEWGTVHFWTPGRLKQSGVPDADLVVLDETHHYLGSSGFGTILDEIDGDVLGLSGSLDETNAKSLERRDIPNCFEFTLREGQLAGVIPTCDWNVVLTPYQDQSRLVEATEACRAGIERYGDGLPAGSVDLDDDTTYEGFETLSEARSLAQSSVGRQLKESDPAFREFASAVMTRQLTQYNLSPSVSTVVRLTLDHVDRHKCVVLLENRDEIRTVTQALESRLDTAYESLVTVIESDSDEALADVREFDDQREVGAIVGIAGTLGEGVDIETADVAINRGRGRLSRSLIQRMGRILRNPDGEKHAQFIHVMGVPTREEAVVSHEDAPAFLETASQLVSWGEGFYARPVFDIDEESSLTEHAVAEFERDAVSAIESLGDAHYSWPANESVRSTLEDLVARIPGASGSVLLDIERQERPEALEGTDGNAATTESEGAGGPPTREPTVEFVAADGAGIEVPGWLYDLLAAARDDRDVDAFAETVVREYVREAYPFPEPDDTSVPHDETAVIPVNPALEAVLSAYATGPDQRQFVVLRAVAAALMGRTTELVERVDGGPEERTVRDRLVELSGGETDA